LVIHSGDDGLTLPFMALGAVGITSVVSNFAPREMVAMVEAWHGGNTAKALALHELMAELTETLFIESNPAPIKAALALAGLIAPEMRLPLVPVREATRTTLREVMKRFEAAAAEFQERR
jgi:4-hydroxy-tetrahydrodipicolinate synthase